MAEKIQSQGIQQLLAAEKKATDKVSAARRRKAKRLRQAKEEGEDEVEQFRKERDQQFRDYVNKHVGTREDAEASIEIETNRKIEELTRAALSQYEPAVQGVLLLIQDIKPKIHQNLRLGEKEVKHEEY